jgi:hypothetical protein
MTALQISQEQLHTLGQAMLQRFEQSCLSELRRDHSELTQPHGDDVLLQFVRHGIARAAALQVTGVSDVKDWLALMLRLGSGFDVDPRFAGVMAILGRTEVPAQLRLAEVEAWLAGVGKASRDSSIV